MLSPTLVAFLFRPEYLMLKPSYSVHKVLSMTEQPNTKRQDSRISIAAKVGYVKRFFHSAETLERDSVRLHKENHCMGSFKSVKTKLIHASTDN